MRCLIDTNILISAALFPNSVPWRAYMKAVAPPHAAVVCDYSLDEMHRVFNRKFPERIPDLEHFLDLLALSVDIVATPLDEGAGPKDEADKIRDLKDRPIYRAAVAVQADAILTGDKDFLESGILYPEMLTASVFVSR